MFGKRPTDSTGKPAGSGENPRSAAPSPGAQATAQLRPQALSGGNTADPRAQAAKGAPPAAPKAAGDIATRPQGKAEAPRADGERSTDKAAKSGKMSSGIDQIHKAQTVTEIVREQSDYYHATKTAILNALLNTIDLSQLAQLDQKAASEEIRDIVSELVTIKNVSMSVVEQDALVQDIINDVLGYGPLEPLLARDDIADIMVNGAGRVFIEVSGKVQLTNVRFRDNGQLMNICQRIVSQVGRRVDESSPICDARLPDGSRVNVIAPPLALDGP
ncbi:MAG: ATPase, T2SS/T4P/T4SS family, partial [Asticcacaulis sp.]